MTAALVTVGILMSCGGGDDGPSATAGQTLLRAIDGTWPVNVASSDVAEVEGTPDLTGLTVTVTPSSDETGATFSFSGGSNFTGSYFTGGSFTVSDLGAIGSPALDAANGSSLDVSSTVIVATATTVTITAQVEAEALRSAGVGTWSLVFDVD